MSTSAPKRRSRLWVRLAVGLFLLTLVCIHFAEPKESVDDRSLVGPAIAAPVETVVDSRTVRLEDLAKTDHLALLRKCLQHYELSVRDYTCRFIKRERISGRLGRAQEIDVRFMDHPFSVAMRWRKNAPISDRALFVEGAHGGNMLLRPKGLLSIVGTVRRKPDSEQVMANTLRPISRFGFKRSLSSLIGVYELAAKRGDLKTRFVGRKEVDGREAFVLERILPARPDYPAHRTLVYIDAERLLPICVEAWNWDNKLMYRYIFGDVKLNVGLTADDFTTKANGL